MPTNNFPTSFLCPLTMEVMEDPVMDKCAHNFERKAVVAWLSTGHHAYCPISRKPLCEADLVPNHTLAERIERWKWQRSQSTMACIEADLSIPNSPSFSEDEEDCSDPVETSVKQDGKFKGEGDLELGKKKRMLNRVVVNKRILASHCLSIPADFVLLPQERLILQMMHATEEEENCAMWKKKVCLAVIIGTLATFPLILLTIKRLVSLKRDDNE